MFCYDLLVQVTYDASSIRLQIVRSAREAPRYGSPDEWQQAVLRNEAGDDGKGGGKQLWPQEVPPMITERVT